MVELLLFHVSKYKPTKIGKYRIEPKWRHGSYEYRLYSNQFVIRQLFVFHIIVKLLITKYYKDLDNEK